MMIRQHVALALGRRRRRERSGGGDGGGGDWKPSVVVSCENTKPGVVPALKALHGWHVSPPSLRICSSATSCTGPVVTAASTASRASGDVAP